MFVGVGFELAVKNSGVFGEDIVELTLECRGKMSTCVTNLLKVSSFVVCWEDCLFGVKIIGQS